MIGRWWNNLKRVVVLGCLLATVLHAQSAIDIYFTGELNGVLRSESAKHGGLLQVNTAFKLALRGDSLPYLLLDTGNALASHYHGRFDQGRTILSIMKSVGYDAMTPGNRDLHYGLSHLLELQSAGVGPQLVSANMLQAEGKPAFLPVSLFSRGDIKVGVIGFTAPDLKERILPEHLSGVTLESGGEKLAATVRKARSDADLLIGLTTLDLAGSIELAGKYAQLDLILRRPEDDSAPLVRVNNASGKTITIAMSAADAQAVNKISVTSNDADGRWTFTQNEPIPVAGVKLSAADRSRYMEVDAAYARYAEGRWQGLTADSVLGQFGDDPLAQVREYQLYQMLKSTRSEIAILNGGFLRNKNGGVLTSALRLRDLDAVNWTDNHLITFRLKGAALKSILKKGAAYPENSSRRLHSLAISRVPGKLLTIHGNDIVDNETYAVVTSRFLADGGDGYTTFLQGTRRRTLFRGQGRLYGVQGPDGRRIALNDALIDWMRGGDRPVQFAGVSDWLAENPFLGRALWLVNLRQVDFMLRQVTVNNNERFSAAPDARINAASENFFSLGFDGDFGVLRRSERLIWENRLLLRHARTRQGGDELEETDDYLEFRSVFDTPLPQRLFRLPRKFNLFGSGRIETELTPTVDVSGVENPRRQDAYLTAGLSYLGRWVDELRFGYYAKWNLQDGSRDSGMEFSGRYGKGFGRLGISSQLRTRYNISISELSAGDERASLELKNALVINLTGNLSVKPRIDFFAWHDAVLKETATNIQYIVGLSYAKVWKPQYLRWR